LVARLESIGPAPDRQRSKDIFQASGAMFRINLTTGAAMLVGTLSTGQTVRGFALQL
jgi:hypothetical protein